jgi:hypothetical protein
MNVARGIIAALIWAAAGIIVPVVVVGGYTILSWHFNDTLEVDRDYDIAWWRMHAVPPLVGVPIYLGLTAWATYTPKRNHGFAKTLAIIFFTAIPSTWFLAALEMTPRRYKSIEHPDIYVSEFLLFFLPPLIMSCILVAIRRSDSQHVDTADEEPYRRSNVTAT